MVPVALGTIVVLIAVLTACFEVAKALTGHAY
jgi:hypothetical protein